ncbi:unnamed protein product [Mytilus coruscus]|uniref:Uncharacterized protein n=1 Tax=Mytilus coruscus TaxID=42192 RepID=A0A6J8B0N0_MYTCO|nr:unnamed protein product [Mytilus coruscus]
MNISKVSTEAVLTFDDLTYIDQINYSCSSVYLDQNSKTERRNSGFTSLFFKGYNSIGITDADNQAIIRCIVNSPLAQPTMYIDTMPMEVQSPDLETTIETRRTTSGTTIGINGTDSTDQPELISASEYIAFYVCVGIAVLLLLIVGICVCKRTGKKKSSRYQVNEKSNTSLSKQTIQFKQVSLADSYEKIPLQIDTGKETTMVDIVDIQKQNMVYIESLEKDDKNKFSTNSSSQHTEYAQVNETDKTQYLNNTQTQTISIQKGMQSQDSQKDINDHSAEKITNKTVGI